MNAYIYLKRSGVLFQKLNEGDEVELVYATKMPYAHDDVSVRNEEVLNNIYNRFNVSYPHDYRERSLSIGDVVGLERWGVERFYEVASFGFNEVDPDSITIT